MPTSKEICPECKMKFFGRQAHVTCTKCDLRYHLKCTKLRQKDLETLTSDGKTFYHCKDCLSPNKSKVSTTDIPLRELTLNEEDISLNLSITDNQQAKKKSTDSTERYCCIKAQDYLKQIMEELLHLRKEVAILSAENKAMKITLSKNIETNDEILSKIATLNKLQTSNEEISNTVNRSGIIDLVDTSQSLSDMTYSKIARSNSTEINESSAKNKIINYETNLKLPKKQIQKNRLIYVNSNKRQPIIGTNSTSLITSAPPKSKFKKYFVSKLSGSTSSEDLKNYLESILNVTVICHKLTKDDKRSSSFYVSVPEDITNRIENPDTFPAGVWLLPFKGNLNRILLKLNNNSNTNLDIAVDDNLQNKI